MPGRVSELFEKTSNAGTDRNIDELFAELGQTWPKTVKNFVDNDTQYYHHNRSRNRLELPNSGLVKENQQKKRHDTDQDSAQIQFTCNLFYWLQTYDIGCHPQRREKGTAFRRIGKSKR